MDAATLTGELRRLGEATATLAAIGAALSRFGSAEPGHAQTDATLRAVVEAALPGALETLDAKDLAAALATVTLQMTEAYELVSAPARAPGWTYRDAGVLIAQGRISRAFPRALVQLSRDRPALSEALTGRFLDVGTGVGELALEAATLCPTLHVVGLDIWEPALAIARAAVSESPHGARIEIRTQDITQLDEPGAYTIAWLPTSFMPRAVAEAALDRIQAALAPGGYLVVGTRTRAGVALPDALAELRVLRSGGYPWQKDEMIALLGLRGFGDIEVCPGPGGVNLILARNVIGFT